jgi:hypothetical protein
MIKKHNDVTTLQKKENDLTTYDRSIGLTLITYVPYPHSFNLACLITATLLTHVHSTISNLVLYELYPRSDLSGMCFLMFSLHDNNTHLPI